MEGWMTDERKKTEGAGEGEGQEIVQFEFPHSTQSTKFYAPTHTKGSVKSHPVDHA
jgi:hypothetical protein